jgi:hypothetical protein
MRISARRALLVHILYLEMSNVGHALLAPTRVQLVRQLLTRA